MRLAHHLLRHRSGVFHFRLVVPRDLQASIGLRIIKRSLGTRDPQTAKAWAYALGARYAHAFATARRQQQGMDWDEYLRGLGRFEIKQGPHGPEVKTNGTEADNAAALRALELLRPVAAPVLTSPPRVKRRIDAMKAANAWLGFIRIDTLPKTWTIKAAAVRAFVEHFGSGKSLDEAQREDIAAWVQALRQGGLQTPTIINKLSYLGGFLSWAVQQGYYPNFRKDENPAAGHISFGTKDKRKRRALGFKPFTEAQVKALYSPSALAELSEGARWGALIGLYTGARASEVGQLALSDFKTADGLPCLTVTDEGLGQSVKTHASLRTIPIHPDLLLLGLMERVEALRKGNETRLFPRVKIGGVNGAGNFLSKAFTRHIEARKIPKPEKGKHGFHSLRKTLVHGLQDLKVPKEVRAGFVGHEVEVDEHEAAYSRKPTIAEMNEAISRLSWGLDLPKIRGLLWE